MLHITGTLFSKLPDRRCRMGANTLRIGLIAAIVVAAGFLAVSKSGVAWHWNSQDPADIVPVLVAGRYIPAFAVIKPDMVHAQNFPKGFVPPGAIKSKAELANDGGQLLFTSVVSIPEGQPVTRALVADASQND